jgi:Icc-related predicted phosphoesterase
LRHLPAPAASADLPRPPQGTLFDRVRDSLHAGSQAVREFVDRYQPEFSSRPHHEAEGVTVEMGKTKASNVGKRGWPLNESAMTLEE